MKEGWDYKKLDEVCYVEYGTRVVQKKDGGTIYPVYGGGGETFRMDRFNRSDSIVIARFAMSKQCTRFVKGKFFLNDSGLTIRSKVDKIAQNFLNWHIIALNDEIYLLGKGMAQKNLDMPSFRNITLKIPPLSEQQHIVEELDLLSSIIEKKKAQLNELDNLAQSLFYEMFGDPITNEKGWEVKKLGKLCITSSGGTPSKTHKEYYEGGNIPWLRSGEVAQGYIYNTEMYITEEGLNNSSAKYFPINTVVVAMYGATVGQVGILKSRMTTNQAICGIFPSESFVPTFLMFFLKGMKPVYLKDAAGGAQPNISQGVIKNTLVPIVSIALQQQFVERIEAVEHQKELIKKSIKEVETLFNSRMDYYFN